MFTSTALFAAMLAMAPLSVNAHMIMANPVPYGSPNNSPLDPSGSDFPCKVGAGGSYEVKKMNDWAVGSKQTLSFTGTAVHGGGSCQVAVTTDKTPSPSSKWKVIYSIEGGCPASTPGNLGAGGALGTFPFDVPSELPNGEMTMAWTWFNKVGNREMYMNCAPITVSGGSDDSAAFDSLPDMAVANIQGQGSCKTSEGSDYTFENPGKYKTEIGTGPFVSLCGGAPAGGSGGVNPGSGSPPVANPGIPVTPSAPAPSAPASSTPIGTSTLRTIITVTAPQGPKPTEGGVFAPGASAPTPKAPLASQSSSAPQPSPAPSTPKPSQAPTIPVNKPDNVNSGTGTGTGTGTGAGDSSCSPDGALVCNGEAQFGLCNWGKVIWQDVAAGTKCQNGKIAKREYTHRAQRTAV
ncbi:lytic polysaccharide monooxygenase [Dothidotthia symphoricarpi CBS 119687]|uniref:Lytic polysaccharide monooxygenase n=1 Tax=Dothidotthia symphoricarpi CBS 119687 TaxID=1392245 RepID=A0A6A6AHU9_9PLEO|nr:lytic polysaccharide monooxygenase [Dothidotthia symphoricarpi CBS 119687]KAF2131562.1 lytic polysaccharide monooxygenase [Dothidotthia symphoricarpi CBS 119687]